MLKLLSLKAPTTSQLLSIWRRERSIRVGRALSYAGLFLVTIAITADIYFKAEPAVLITDGLLLLGCAATLYLLKKAQPPAHHWLPLLGAFWINCQPFFWATGGLNSPFFGICLAALYVIATVLDTRTRSSIYFIFAILHLPVYFALGRLFAIPAAPALPEGWSMVVNAINLGAIFACVHSLLFTENELAQEFTEHYGTLKSAKDDLKKRELQLLEAQSVAKVGSWEWDVKNDVITWSDELFKIFDLDKNTFDPSFAAYLQRMKPEARDGIQALIQNAVATGEDFMFEHFIETSDGEKVILGRGRVVKDQNGQTIRLHGTAHDITDRKRIESELMRAHKDLEIRVKERTHELELANQAKMQFLANMSHEIRTPMNSILGFSELLASEPQSLEDSKEYLARIRANGDRLMRLIDDILDLSKFEAGSIPIRKNSFSLKALIEGLANSFSPQLKSRGLNLQVMFVEEARQLIHSDADRISQVVTNLLNNSIKFSENGDVKMRVSQIEFDDHIEVAIDVEDSGIGISEENRKRLFQPFSQGDSSIGRKFGGTGLGLALSQRIAHALGGSLELKNSQPGQGSHFRFQFKAGLAIESSEVAKVEKEQNTLPPPLRGKRVLLAEDSSDNATLVRRFVAPVGLEIDLVTDGNMAVTAAVENDYDCILMDIQMPGMDGLEATRRIRERGYTKPIIALTAHALPTEAEKSLLAGCDVHLTKPIRKAELLDTLKAHLGPTLH